MSNHRTVGLPRAGYLGLLSFYDVYNVRPKLQTALSQWLPGIDSPWLSEPCFFLILPDTSSAAEVPCGGCVHPQSSRLTPTR